MKIKPIEEGNASEIHEVCYPLIKLIMLRYEAISDFLAEEPYFIHIKKEKDTKTITCEKIMSLFLDVNNSHTVTYTIFSNEREEFSQDWYSVVRKVYWDKKSDQLLMKENPDQREAYINAWPSITIKSIITRGNDAVKGVIEGVDRIVVNGIVLSPRKEALPNWKDIAVMRRFDWGEVRNCWGASHQNTIMEEYIFDSLRKLEQVVTGEQSIFHKMMIDYQILPELFHRSITGE